MTKMTMSEIQKEISGFSGTEQYHKCSIVPNYVCTDGVAHLAEFAKCYWLLDAIASYQRTESMQFWKLTIKDKKAELIMQEDSGLPILVKQKFTYTDLPDGEINIWIGIQRTSSRDEDNTNLYVMMLPSEY